MSLFLTVCLNPTIQKTYVYKSFTPDSVNRTSLSFLDISGKGINVTRTLNTLGEKAIHLTHAGGPFAAFFRKRAHEEGLRVKAVSAKTDIRFCTTIVDQRAGHVTEIVEEGFPVDAKTEAGIRRSFGSLLRKSSAVVISGARAPGYSGDLVPDMVRLARRADAFVLIDIRGSDLVNSLPYAPQVIKPNLSEFIATFFPGLDPAGRDEEVMEQAGEKLTRLAADSGVRAVVTDGSRRIMYTDDGTLKTMSPEAVEPVNTTGCGDAFAAGFASAFIKSRRMDDAVRFAAHCAARNALTFRPGFMADAAAVGQGER